MLSRFTARDRLASGELPLGLLWGMYLNDVFTIPTNLAGNCAVSIPGDFSEGLPVGVQLIGPAWGEAALLRVADAFERATDYHTRMPELAAPGRKPRRPTTA